ncbi:MAG: enoyl-CoA hydratase/isomerase family protein [Dehalococcoidia bacterium]
MTAETQPLVIEERHGAVAVITLNRPERLHALSQALSIAIDDAFERAEADPEVACIVLTGSGERAFCAGADMLEASGVTAPSGQPQRTGRAITTVERCPLPVIAAINGVCYGGGARLAVSCDIRLASETATFRLPGSEYGLVVAAATLPRLVGAARAKELIFTARKFNAEEAYAYGLVTSLHKPAELMPAALEMAQSIAGHSAGAVREAKRVIDQATLDEKAIAMENEANKVLRGSPEQVARFRSATQKVTGR